MTQEIHELKIWPPFFNHILTGAKTFEVRKNDRNFKIGDDVILKEFDPDENKYTGEVCLRRINYILEGGQFGIEKDYCVIGLY